MSDDAQTVPAGALPEGGLPRDVPLDGAAIPPRPAARHRRGPLVPVLVIGCIAMIVVAGLTVMIIIELRSREMLSARHQLMAFDILLAEQTERALQGVDLVVNEVADELQMSGVTTAAAFDRLTGDAQLYDRLRQKIINIPQLDAITLDSADGHLINFSRFYPIPQVSIADRTYFQTMRDDPSRVTMISEPVRNRGDGIWDIYLAHRISGPHGEFVGLVLGAMRVDYFESLYETLSIAGGTSIGLWRQDGTLLAHFPRFESAMGRRFPSKMHFAQMASGETSVAVDRSDVDGLRRMIASHLLTREGIVVDASQTMNEVLADFRHDALVIGVSGFVCTLAAGLLVWALVRQFIAYEAMASAVAGREEAVHARHVAEGRLRVAQKMEAIGRITSGVAHDFNNLLTSIIANAELLQRAAAAETSWAKRVSTILQAADRGAALVRQLLAFSRQQVLAPARVESGPLLEGMTELLESALGAGLEVRLRIANALWPILVDPVQFEHMVLNLAINARDAQEGSGVVTITAENVPADHADRPDELSPGDYVVVSVNDAGTGMSEEVMRNVFEPFFTTKPLGRGSGLGLSQVYGVARQSGGTVRIRSTLGIGTTVQVFLPRAVGSGFAEGGVSAVPAAASGAAVGRVVLLVDDDAPVRETLAATLTEAGFAVVEAADGMAALAKIDAGLQLDVLLVDRHMPVLDGAAVAAEVRARRPGLAVVFMTGDAEGEAVRRERWVIQKPFLAGQISRVLQEALEMSPVA